MHSLSTGLSMNYDGFDENLVQYAGGESVRHAYDRTEVVPGAYAQYTFNLNDKLILLAGVRADYSTLYDFFVTPRVHIKYNPFDWFHIRASAGKGFRTANVLAENNFLLSSSRKMYIADNLDYRCESVILYTFVREGTELERGMVLYRFLEANRGGYG